MGSSDLFISVKAPGLIGTFFAFLVLIGFGVLFFLARDGVTASEGKSLAATVRDTDKTIALRTRIIEASSRKFDILPARKKTSADLFEAETKNNFLGLRIAKRSQEIEEIREEITKLKVDFEDYKNQYRAFVRNAAKGTEIDHLTTLSGETYTQVRIRKVTAIGMDIRHRDGFKRIGFEELPKEFQDHYQFEMEQMLVAVQKEAEIRRLHEAAVAASTNAAEAKAAQEWGLEAEKEKNDKRAENF